MFLLIRQLLKFWLVLMLAAVAAYLLIFNQERIYINLPGIGEFRVIAALAFLISFAVGATTVTFYFGADVLRKTWEIKRQNKRIRHLERKLEDFGGAPVEANKRKSWFGKKEPEVLPSTKDPSAIRDRDIL